MFVGVVGRPRGDSVEPTTSGGELMVTVHGSGVWQPKKRRVMKMLGNKNGKVGWILLWALGIPIPILVILFMMRGCT